MISNKIKQKIRDFLYIFLCVLAYSFPIWAFIGYVPWALIIMTSNIVLKWKLVGIQACGVLLAFVTLFIRIK